MINARAEGIATRPAYQEALARRRCIIPADAFYEWQVLDTAVNGGQRQKQPYAFRAANREPLAFAGLWEVWRDRDDPQAEPLQSCVIITTRANEVVAPFHHRMPVVLGRQDWDAWLDRDTDDVAALQRLLLPAPAGDLEVWPVSSRVNNSANEGPDLLEPA
jgi:putative SOS response-associated peptidase YedK